MTSFNLNYFPKPRLQVPWGEGLDRGWGRGTGQPVAEPLQFRE